MFFFFKKKRKSKLWNKCAFKHSKKAGRKLKKRKSSSVVTKTLDHTKLEESIISLKFIAKEDFLHGVAAIPRK